MGEPRGVRRALTGRDILCLSHLFVDHQRLAQNHRVLRARRLDPRLAALRAPRPAEWRFKSEQAELAPIAGEAKFSYGGGRMLRERRPSTRVGRTYK